ncbi:hypothetical protein [Sphingomonas aracearum]|nr:hypothetical protein [Sphingomonas aracearum]
MTIDIADLPDLATPIAAPGAIRMGEIAVDELFDFTVSIVVIATGGA